MAPALRIAVAAVAAFAAIVDTAFAVDMKVEQVKQEVEAVECGKSVLVSDHGVLKQAPPPRGTNPETCKDFKFSLKDLTAVDQHAFKDMVNLESVILYGNQISEFHPDTFKDTRNLKHLMLSGNAFKTLPANLFRNLQKLTFLDIYALMSLEDVPRNLLDPLGSLEKLYAGDLRLTNDHLKEGLLDGVMHTIQHLSLGHNALTQFPGEIFSKMDALTTLSVSQNKITKMKKKDLKPLVNKLDKLHTFVLSGNPLKCCDFIDGLPEAMVKAMKESCPEKKCVKDKEKKAEEPKEEKKEEEKPEGEEEKKEDKEGEKEEKKEEEKAETDGEGKEEAKDTRDEL